MNISIVPAPLIAYYPPAHQWQEAFRTCSYGLCLPCPFDGPEFGERFQNLEGGYPILATLAIASMLFLFSCYAVLPNEITRKNVYTIGLASSYVVSGLAFLISFNLEQQTKTTCVDSITRASGLRVSRCAVSGMFVVYGYVSSRIWLCLWVLKMHIQIVWRKTIADRPWIPTLHAVGVSLICACVSIPYLEYTIGPICLPRLGLPIQLLLEIPITIYDGTSLIIQCWTFAHILYMLAHTPRSAHPDSNHSKYNPLHFLQRMADSPLGGTWHLLARPVVYTSLSLMNTLLFACAFFRFTNPWDPHGGPSRRWMTRTSTWFECLVKYQHNNGAEKCTYITNAWFNYRLMVASWYYWLILCLVFSAICIRWEMLVAMKDLVFDRKVVPVAAKDTEFSIDHIASTNTTPKDTASVSAQTKYVPNWPDFDRPRTPTMTMAAMTDSPILADPIVREDYDHDASSHRTSIVSETPRTPNVRHNLDRAESELNAYLDTANCSVRKASSSQTIRSSGEKDRPISSPPEPNTTDWSLNDSLPWASPTMGEETTAHRPQLGTAACGPRTRYSSDSGVRPFYDL